MITTVSSGSFQMESGMGTFTQNDPEDQRCQQNKYMIPRQPINNKLKSDNSDVDGCASLLESRQSTTRIVIPDSVYHHDHNDWDKVRAIGKWTYLRCRQCEERWKVESTLCFRLKMGGILSVNTNKLNVEQ